MNGMLEIDPDPMDEECECIGWFALTYQQGDKGKISWVDWHSYVDTDVKLQTGSIRRWGSAHIHEGACGGEGSYVACIVKYIVLTMTAMTLCMLETTSVKGWGKEVMELALGSHLWQ